jgi:hypothetical protein
MKIKKLDARGFSHHFVLALIVLVVAIGGVYYLVASHADSLMSNPANHSFKTEPLTKVVPPSNVTRNVTSLAKVNSGNTNPVIYADSWSGYFVSGNTFNSVNGDIKVPKVQCTSAEVAESLDETVFWVGLDGAEDNTVEQTGIGVTCVNLPGGGIGPQYVTWWEMYPGNDNQNMSMPIYAGDVINMKVNYAAGIYTFTVSDLTKKTTETALSQCSSFGYSCDNSSAEWIAERNGDGAGYGYLIDWGTAKFYDDTTNAITDPAGKMFPITHYSNTPVYMYNRFGTGDLLATVPDTLTKNKEFPDTWLATQ